MLDKLVRKKIGDGVGDEDGSVVKNASRDTKVLTAHGFTPNCTPPTGPLCHRCATASPLIRHFYLGRQPAW